MRVRPVFEFQRVSAFSLACQSAGPTLPVARISAAFLDQSCTRPVRASTWQVPVA